MDGFVNFNLFPLSLDQGSPVMRERGASEGPVTPNVLHKGERNLMTKTREKVTNITVAQRLAQWLKEKSGVIREIGGHGAREAVVELRRWHRTEYGRVLL